MEDEKLVNCLSQTEILATDICSENLGQLRKPKQTPLLLLFPSETTWSESTFIDRRKPSNSQGFAQRKLHSQGHSRREPSNCSRFLKS